MADRVTLAERVDPEDLADALNDWGETTPGNRARWHGVVRAALAPDDDQARVVSADATAVEDLSPLDPLEEDPATYNATATVDASIERRPADGEPEIEDVVEAIVVIELTATLGETPEGGTEVVIHDVGGSAEPI